MSKGLGDTINKITTFTGIKHIVEYFSKLLGIDCGCNFGAYSIPIAKKFKKQKIYAFDASKWNDGADISFSFPCL